MAYKSVELLREVLKSYYPKDLIGIGDDKAVLALLNVLKKNKKYEWMDEDWRVNASSFLTTYMKETDNVKYLVNTLYKLKDRAKDWRENYGPKQKSLWVETG